MLTIVTNTLFPEIIIFLLDDGGKVTVTLVQILLFSLLKKHKKREHY